MLPAVHEPSPDVPRETLPAAAPCGALATSAPWDVTALQSSRSTTWTPEDRLVKQARRTRQQVLSRTVAAALAFLLPATVAGCPEFRNQVVDATETAVIGIVLGLLVAVLPGL